MLRVPVEFPWGLAPGERGGAPRAFHVSSRDAGVKSGWGKGTGSLICFCAFVHFSSLAASSPPAWSWASLTREHRLRRHSFAGAPAGASSHPIPPPPMSTSVVWFCSGPEGRGELAAAHRSAVLEKYAISMCFEQRQVFHWRRGVLCRKFKLV